MGWMSRATRTATKYNSTRSELLPETHKHQQQPNVSHVEVVPDTRQYPLLPAETKDQDLPFISAETVASCRGLGFLWLVIDNIVYDCTHFANEHPGGVDVLNSFCGSDCSWQFWRFHEKKHIVEWGKPLRIGITKDVRNKFKEPPRFVGLRTTKDD